MLPVELRLDVNVAGLKQGADYEGFAGVPAQERVEITTGKKGTVTGGKLSLQLPPYSLQVIEM